MKEPDFKHINDESFNDLLRQFMLEDDSSLTEEVLNASSSHVYSSEATVKPSAEKEAAMLEKLGTAAPAGTTAWWSNTWVIVTAIVATFAGGYLLMNAFEEEPQKETAATTVDALKQETDTEEEIINPVSEEESNVIDAEGNTTKAVNDPAQEEENTTSKPVTSDDNHKPKEEPKINPLAFYPGRGNEASGNVDGDYDTAGDGLGHLPKRAQTNSGNDAEKSTTETADVTSNTKDEDLKRDLKKTDFHQAPKGQVIPEKGHTFSPGKTAEAMSKYVGDYENPKTGEVYKFRVKKGQLVAKGRGMHNIELLSVNEDGTTIPVVPEDKKVILFTRGSNNNITGFYYSDEHVKHDRFEKVVED